MPQGGTGTWEEAEIYKGSESGRQYGSNYTVEKWTATIGETPRDIG